jgi:redox-sensing transcriptional repressor
MRMYQRLISYLRYLQSLPADAVKVSSAIIGAELGVNDVQVRKDLAAVSSGGRPKIGYVTACLIADITRFLGYENNSEAVLVGVGNLGRSLLTYRNFKEYGLNIIAAFDNDPALVGHAHCGIQILDVRKTADLCRRLNVHIGIITVPAEAAQDVCDCLIEGGIRAVWNFAPVNLKVPEAVRVRNEDMAASLALLMRQAEEKI